VHRVSNPSTLNLRISTPDHALWYTSKLTFILELVVHINLKGVCGIEITPPRIELPFSCDRITHCYGVAVDSRIDKIIGLFCRIMSLLQGSFTKETYNLIDPTNCSHPIGDTSLTFGQNT